MTSLVEIQSGREDPLYNIGVVSRMTGVSMATLRAWERRYDFPESKRTEGGHRLYTERDIFRLRWVKERIDEGMQTSQAIRALRNQEETGLPILTKEALAEDKHFAPEQRNAARKESREEMQSFFDSSSERLLDAMVNHNLRRADDLLAEALALYAPEVLILNIIRPVLFEIGRLWEQGKLDVATEHLATNYLRERLLMWMVSGPPPLSPHRIVLACAPEEWHEGSLLILGALLRRRLWPVVYLGQSVPLPDLAKFVQDVNPSMVVIVAMTEKTATNLMSWQQWLPEAATKSKPIVGYGGLVFVEKPEWRMKVPGIYLGDSFEEGISAIEKLLRA